MNPQNKSWITHKRLEKCVFGTMAISYLITCGYMFYKIVNPVTNDINKDGAEDRFIEHYDGKRTIEYGIKINDKLYYAPENCLKK